MRDLLIDVTFFLSVHDAAALRAAAFAADPELPESASLAECCRVLLHPIEPPAGCDILESTATVLPEHFHAA